MADLFILSLVIKILRSNFVRFTWRHNETHFQQNLFYEKFNYYATFVSLDIAIYKCFVT